MPRRHRAEGVGIIVQARMASKRLPGKALLDIEGKPLLRRLCDRMRFCRNAEGLTVATSQCAHDDAIEEACRAWGIEVHRGPEEDLTTRLLGAVTGRGWSAFVRVTGDNPLTDPAGIDEMIEKFYSGDRVDNKSLSIVHNAHRDGYPYGTGAELVSRHVLEECDRELRSPSERECFMSFARNSSSRFPCVKMAVPSHLRRRHYFLTVDYAADLEVQGRIYRHFQGRDDMTLAEIIDFLDANPQIAELNSDLHEAFII
ncbi:MAG TPA: NTP transferase domain-containing protein [Candidatus Acidoferrales bacterium]|nr:NTP transferase domain-containing protein [Candidatus Acidoferrales bacterium]